MFFNCHIRHESRWGDGTSRNHVSLYEVSGTVGHKNKSSLNHYVPALNNMYM